MGKMLGVIEKLSSCETLFLTAFLGGGMVFILCMIVRWICVARQRKRRERQRCMEEKRKLQYALPRWDNGYIRTRLQNSLKVEEIGEEGRQVRVHLGYARVLLGKIKEAPLTIADRLQAEEMCKTFALYRGKECWTASELRGLNDLCSALLKLSAKYAV